MTDDPSGDLIVCTPERLSSLVTSAVKDAMGSSTQLLVDKQILAKRLCCSPTHIDNLRKAGMPWVSVGQAVRFEPGAVLAWLKANGHKDESDDDGNG